VIRLWLPSSKERFFIVELLPEGRRGLIVALDKERHLSLEKIVERVVPQDLARWQKMRPAARHIIIAVHHSLAMTVTVPIKLEREAELHRELVSAVELENLLAQSMVKVFNQYRESVARALNVDELDAILVGNKVHSFKVDGHHVMSPLGFTGSVVSAVLELTLTTRPIFEDWKQFFNATKGFFFTELARAELVALHKNESLPIQLIIVELQDGAVFILDKAAIGTMMYRGKLEWRTEILHELISEHWAVSPHVAKKIYHLSTIGHLSPSTARTIQKAMKPGLDALFSRLERTKLRGTVYIETPVPLPFVLPHKDGKVTIADVPLGALIHKLGFSLDFDEWPFEPNQIFRRLAPFLEFYYDKSDSEVNHWLRRRLHWLAPS